MFQLLSTLTQANKLVGGTLMAEIPGTTTDEKNPEEEASMSLYEHLDELRVRVIRSIIAVFVCFGVAFFFVNEILEFLKMPVAEFLPEGKNLGFKDIVEPFMVSQKVALLTAIIAACPYWFFQFWKFIESALYPKERKYIVPFSIALMLLFLTGTAFCFLGYSSNGSGVFNRMG